MESAKDNNTSDEKVTDGTGTQSADAAETGTRKERKPVPVKATVNRARTLLARLIWLVCVLAALSLAIGALLIVLDANRDNALVKVVLDVAGVADLGVFDRNNGIKTFDGANAETKNVLVNWGLGALAWLIAGKIAERGVRP